MGSGSGWLYEGVCESEVARVKSNVFNMRPENVFQQKINTQSKKNIITNNVCMITLLLMKEAFIENAEGHWEVNPRLHAVYKQHNHSIKAHVHTHCLLKVVNIFHLLQV